MAAILRSPNSYDFTGDAKHWDAKLTDFGLHATVEALDTSERSRSM